MTGPVRIGIATLALFFGGFGTWAAVAPLDGAIIGLGTLQVRGNRKTVQHREGGIVSKLLVSEGDRVTQGQVLIQLDNTQVMASLRVHEAALAGDRALIARDLAELSSAPRINFPPDLDRKDPAQAAVMAREVTVFRNHLDLQKQQTEVIAQRMAEAREQAAGARAQFNAAQRGMSLAQQELHAFETLAERGLASRTHVLELERSAEELQGQIGQLRAQIAQHEAEAAELAAESLRLRASAQSDATREMREAQLRINDVLPRIAADRDLLARLDIRAPASGQVVDQTVFTRGGVVEPGKPILDIVPTAPTIVAEAEIRPEDIEHLHVGQPARIVATGFNAREAMPIEGRVDIISADRITDSHNGRIYYRVDVTLIADGNGGSLLRRLSPGMPVEVTVPVKPRTALEYLLEPLRTSFHKAGREL